MIKLFILCAIIGGVSGTIQAIVQIETGSKWEGVLLGFIALAICLLFAWDTLTELCGPFNGEDSNQ